MGLKTDNDFMVSSLSSMLKNGEQLYDPFYGCLMETGFFKTVNSNRFGFFGRTNSDLLIAILSPLNGKRIDWVNRVPLDVRKIRIHKSLIPKQYIIKIVFNEGNPCKIRVSLKLLGSDFIDQEENARNFMAFLNQYRN